jgi:hypothetical protein
MSVLLGNTIVLEQTFAGEPGVTLTLPLTVTLNVGLGENTPSALSPTLTDGTSYSCVWTPGAPGRWCVQWAAVDADDQSVTAESFLVVDDTGLGDGTDGTIPGPGVNGGTP